MVFYFHACTCPSVCECSAWGPRFGPRRHWRKRGNPIQSALTPPAYILISFAPKSLTPSCFSVFISSSYPLAYFKVSLILGGIYRPKVTQKGRKCCFHLLEAFHLSGTRCMDYRVSCSRNLGATHHGNCLFFPRHTA